MDRDGQRSPPADTHASNPRWRRFGGRARIVLFGLVTAVVLLVRPAMHHARAASLLVTFAASPGTSAGEGTPTLVREEPTTFRVGARTVRGRLYVPASSPDAPGIVMVHGVHRLGIEEPRLQRFARAVAGSGHVVLTPEVTELRDYQVAAPSIDTVGAAVLDLRARLGSPRVGVMGMSFGGGISLLAAADARFAESVGFVVAIGAHGDLARVLRFFATDTVVDPDGTVRTQHAHAYGATVLAYAHAAELFPPSDVDTARDALRSWLHEDRDAARATATRLSPGARIKAEQLFDGDLAALRGELLEVLGRHEDAMRAVSPHGNLGGMRAAVYLLHGEADSVIPASETLWLARDVPADRLRVALVSPAIQHVELKEPNLRDQWALVHFMGEVLGDAARTR